MTKEHEANLDKYADLVVNLGLNLQPGQSLLVAGSALTGVDIYLAPFVRLVAEKAYRRGAPLVDVIWWDPALECARFKLATADSFRSYPKWLGNAMVEHHEAGNAYLVVYAEDPGLLADFNPTTVAARLAAIGGTVAAARAYRSRNAINWAVVSAPTPAWAAHVFPGLAYADAEPRLWRLIFEACRVLDADPLSAWRAHVKDLSLRTAHLTHKQYTTLRYTAPETNLTIGLPEGHTWLSGLMVSQSGIPFVANLPTEEVFTLPHRLKVEGTVTATKPLVTSGNSIEGMSLTFSEGKVTQATARKGEAFLKGLLRTDEGTARLGEVALVPHSSPISRMGVTFHNILFDENAASHLALGSAHRAALQGGASATDEQFLNAGGNLSQLHEDFMVGSGALDVDGIRGDGDVEPVMRAGEWAFNV